MPENAQNLPSPNPQILAMAEASRRASLLTALQSALAERGLSSVIAGNHRLVLQGGSGPCEPSGPTDPQLHIFTPRGTEVATTDGSTYQFASGQTHPFDDPAGAASRLEQRSGHKRAALRREPVTRGPLPGKSK